jgi:hypothetical protein
MYRRPVAATINVARRLTSSYESSEKGAACPGRWQEEQWE